MSMLIAFPVAAVYGLFFSLPHPVRVGKVGLEASLAFALIEVLMSIRPLFIVLGIGPIAAHAASYTHVWAREVLTLMLIAVMQFVALAIWSPS